MKRITVLTSFLLLAFTFNALVHAQSDKAEEAPSSQLMLVHVDEVLPAMNTKYEKLAKQFIAELTKHGISDVTLHTSKTDENEYMWASPLKNMAELDEKWYTELMEKMGKEAFSKMFDEMDFCYNNHYSIIVDANFKLSMMPANPGTINQNAYRKFTWYHYKAQDEEKVYAVAQEFKDLYTEAGLTDYNYIIHKPVFSENGSVLIVMGWAKSQEDYLKMQDLVNAKVGDKRKELFAKLNSLIIKKEVKEGMYLPDLSYEPRQLVKVK